MRLIDADALDDIVQELNEEANWRITRNEYTLIKNVLCKFPTVKEPKTRKQINIFSRLKKKRKE